MILLALRDSGCLSTVSSLILIKYVLFTSSFEQSAFHVSPPGLLLVGLSSSHEHVSRFLVESNVTSLPDSAGYSSAFNMSDICLVLSVSNYSIFPTLCIPVDR